MTLCVEGKDERKLEKMLPTAFHGWKCFGKDERYFPDNLFKFINGGAELYLSFGFKELLVRRFHKENSLSLEVDLFDMGSPGNAFGIFKHDLEGEEVGIGQGSECGAGRLRFWKGSYYVDMYAEDAAPSIRETLLYLGNHIAKQIRTQASEPELVSRIPQKGAIPESLRFFHR